MSARRFTTLPAFPPRRFCIRRTEIDCALPIWCYCISERRSKSLRHQGKRALSYRLPWEIDRPSPTRCQTGPRRCCFADARLIPPIPGQRPQPGVFFLLRPPALRLVLAVYAINNLVAAFASLQLLRIPTPIDNSLVPGAQPHPQLTCSCEKNKAPPIFVFQKHLALRMQCKKRRKNKGYAGFRPWFRRWLPG